MQTDELTQSICYDMFLHCQVLNDIDSSILRELKTTVSNACGIGIGDAQYYETRQTQGSTVPRQVVYPEIVSASRVARDEVNRTYSECAGTHSLWHYKSMCVLARVHAFSVYVGLLNEAGLECMNSGCSFSMFSLKHAPIGGNNRTEADKRTIIDSHEHLRQAKLYEPEGMRDCSMGLETSSSIDALGVYFIELTQDLYRCRDNRYMLFNEIGARTVQSVFDDDRMHDRLVGD